MNVKTLSSMKIWPPREMRLGWHLGLTVILLNIPFAQSISQMTKATSLPSDMAGWAVTKQSKTATISVKPGVTWHQYGFVDVDDVLLDVHGSERPITPEEADSLKAILKTEMEQTFYGFHTATDANKRLSLRATVTGAQAAKTGINIATQVAVGQAFAKGGATVVFTLADEASGAPLARFALSERVPFYAGRPWDGFTRTNYLRRCAKRDVRTARKETETLIGPMLKHP